MSLKDKVRLNKITHSVRASQAVLQYGVGAMIDFPSQVLMTGLPEAWNQPEIIHDERLEKLLGVQHFITPSDAGIPFVRFPRWYFCPKCRKFQPIKKSIIIYIYNYNYSIGVFYQFQKTVIL